MQKIIILLIALLFAGQAWSYDFEKDSIAYKITSSNTVEVVSKESEYKGDIIIPNTVTSSGTTYNVTRIGNNAFASSEIISITIGDSVTNIGDYAFSGCTGLASITIGNSVTNIGHYAFSDCSNLALLTMGNKVSSIGNNAFLGTPWYNNQPDGVVYAGKVLYKYKGVMPANTSIAINEGTLGIAGYAFYNCIGLTSLTIPNTVTDIGIGAFTNCKNLIAITIPESVSRIEWGVFYGCTGITSISIPSNIITIGDMAFIGCTGLKSLSISNSVTDIGARAFNNCSSLQDITVEWLDPSKVTYGYSIFFNINMDLVKLYVPKETGNAYWQLETWKDFDIIEKSIILSLHAVNLGINQNITLTYTLLSATVEDVTWNSSNPNIATVDTTGKITAQAIGTAYIIATTEDGEYKDSCLVTVTANPDAIVEINNEKIIMIYPNPTTGQLRITFGELTSSIKSGSTNQGFIWSETLTKVEILDITGKLVYETKDTIFNIGHLPKGVYAIRIFTNKGMVVKKLIKE